MTRTGKFRLKEWLITMPSFVWLLLFFLIPTIIVYLVAFKPHDIYGGIGEGWTLDNLRALFNPNYPIIFWRTIWLSVLTTALCLFLSVPMGYYIARAAPRTRQILLLLVVMPFWSSFLIRIFAWKSLLHPEGVLKKALVFLGIVSSDTSLLYNSGAVLVVMVYSYLPFAILPIFSAASKFNFNLLEAGWDLGATRLQAFFKVFVPGIQKGIITALLMVFIPALGAYVIPDVVGGAQSEMIGNKITQRIFVDRDLPQASLLSAVLSMAVLIPMAVIALFQRRADKFPMNTRE